MPNTTAPPSKAEHMTVESCILDDVEAGCDVASHGNRNQYKDHRTLAIVSIICGLSCIGIISLIYSVKTREMNKKTLEKDSGIGSRKAKEYSHKAFKWAVTAIVALVGLLVLLLLMAGLISYLLTFIN